MGNDVIKLVEELGAVEAVKKIEEDYPSGGRRYKFKDIDSRTGQYIEHRDIRRQIMKNKVPFICPEFLPSFYLCQGLILVGGQSGQGKSTTSANMLAGFLNTSNRPALVISNEEAPDAIYERVACILAGVSYTDFYHKRLRTEDIDMVEDTVVRGVIPRVEVVTEDEQWNMSCVDDVKAVIESCSNMGIVLIDYLQAITFSRLDQDKESFQISKELGLFLKDYGKKNAMPVVCFAQLSSQDAAQGLAGRVQNDKTFFNHAFICIEVVPDVKTLTTKFIIHKDRFNGCTGKEIIMDFRGGRYEMQGGL